jgi:hypothetical protein
MVESVNSHKTCFDDPRKTLKETQAATFCIELPDAWRQNMPAPIGTGFFISPDGWFVTAAHVLMEEEGLSRKVRDDIGKRPCIPAAYFQNITYAGDATNF